MGGKDGGGGGDDGGYGNDDGGGADGTGGTATAGGRERPIPLPDLGGREEGERKLSNWKGGDWHRKRRGVHGQREYLNFWKI